MARTKPPSEGDEMGSKTRRHCARAQCVTEATPMSDHLALFIAGLGNLGSAVVLVLIPTAPTPLWVHGTIMLCAGIGTAAILRAASR